LAIANVPFKLRLKTKKMNKSLASKKKASFYTRYESQTYFWWDSLAMANVPFKLRLKTKNKNRFASLQKESELSF
jgi:adenylate cyclase class IV